MAEAGTAARLSMALAMLAPMIERHGAEAVGRALALPLAERRRARESA